MNIVVYPGNPSPLGLFIQGKRANFAVYSHSASKLSLGLRREGKIQEIALKRSGDIWHTAVEGWGEGMEYAFSINPDIWLADPYSQTLSTSSKWGQGDKTIWSHLVPPSPFDWQNIPKPAIPISDLIIYEMHVRSFTIHPSSGVSHPGSYLGIVEKIPYLRKIGVNAVELMPIFEFDETRTNPAVKGLCNVWGYDPLCFFLPMQRYGTKEEFKTLVRELHKNKIEVLLDVVYNHTGEGGDRKYFFSFRGLDDATYYMLDEQGHYLNYSGCMNTVNVNHPVVTEFILSSLRFWTEEMQIDGFRFDLASILTRGPKGEVLKNPPILQQIANDPRLKNVKLIAEPWDAAGLYQLGQFPSFGPWSEWNGKFRDRVRQFIKGTDDFAGKFADVLCGSKLLYPSKNPSCSINFITAHDGFSLRDLVSYNQKHNEVNGQQNRDGTNQNCSWNCGAEGETDNPSVLALRDRQMRNFFLVLFVSQGVPMLFMGDEYGHTRKGNNNPYVQDNEINWFLWDKASQSEEQIDFVSSLIAFRKSHPELKRTRFIEASEVDWDASNWDPKSRFVACTLKGKPSLFLAFNTSGESKKISLPPGSWRILVRTERPWKEHSLKDPKKGEVVEGSLELASYSSLLLMAITA